MANEYDALGTGKFVTAEPDGDGFQLKAAGIDLGIPTPTPELPDNPTIAGTYTLKCTVVDGVATLSWVSDQQGG